MLALDKNQESHGILVETCCCLIHTLLPLSSLCILHKIRCAFGENHGDPLFADSASSIVDPVRDIADTRLVLNIADHLIEDQHSFIHS